MKSLSLNLGVFLAGLAIFSYAEVWGEGWREFDRNDVEIGYYYVHSVRHLSDKIVRVWVKMEYTDKGLIEKIQKLGKNYENLKYTMMEEEINCSDKKWRNLSLHDYSKEGKVIHSSSRAGEWKRIDLGSMAETLCKAVYK